MKEKGRAILALLTVCIALLLCVLWSGSGKQDGWIGRLKSVVKDALWEGTKAATRLLFAIIYFQVFVALLITVVWSDIYSFFETILQGQASVPVALEVILKHGSVILVAGMITLALYETFLKWSFGEDRESVFETIRWLGNTALALIGALGIYYAVYPEGIYVTAVSKCLCTTATLAQTAEGYLWAEAFLVFFGIAILDFYKVVTRKNYKTKYKCRHSGCEIVKEKVLEDS